MQKLKTINVTFQFESKEFKTFPSQLGIDLKKFTWTSTIITLNNLNYKIRLQNYINNKFKQKRQC